jgi:hypothetical protein
VQVARIVSGGQTGVDRAALDVAIERGVEYAGWCPAGGWAEDHPEPPGLLGRYPGLRATASVDPAERTRLNVRDSDATLVVGTSDAVSAGTALTIAAAVECGRPWLVTTDATEASAWLAALDRPLTLNVAGPRESEAPGAYTAARRLLRRVLAAGG